jgi:hypothetical protein
MRQRLSIVLAATALVVAVLGTTPLGRAAGSAVSAVAPPFAKTAGYAKFAGDSTRLDGRKSTLAGTPGTIPVVGKNGKLPASLGTVGQQGPKGDKGEKGDRGAAGAAGPPGIAGVHLVLNPVRINTPSGIVSAEVLCPSGEQALGGGGVVQQFNAAGFVGVVPLAGSTPTATTDDPVGWFIEIASSAVAGYVVLNPYVICAKTGSAT